MIKEFEYIIVGSGPSGVMAAQSLAEAGRQVAILDVGFKDDHYSKLIPDDDFENIRRTEEQQYRYFIGDSFEAIPLDKLKAGAQTTPPRKFMLQDVEKYIPLSSDTFFPLESLGYGGLGAGWGLGCFVYSDQELSKAGLDPKEIKDAYDVINERIGISCANDDATQYTTAHLKNILPPLKMDNSAERIYKKYLRIKDRLRAKNIFIGNAPLALLSEDYKNRKKTAYQDMDFYSDKHWSAYRAWMTIEELKKYSNFSYLNKILVCSFTENDGKVIVEAKNVDTNESITYSCRKLLLAAGALGSARIVLRSFPDKIKRLPLLCNPYSYIPCIHTAMLGKPLDRFKTSMAQMVMFYDRDNKHVDVPATSLFTYRSLLLNKLAKEAPTNMADTRIIMQYLQSAFVIAGIFHPDEASSQKYLELQKNSVSFTGDQLHAHFALSQNEKEKVAHNEKVIKKVLRTLGCYAIIKMDPGNGGSVHYGGTLPISANGEFGTIKQDGKLNGTDNIFIADGSGFRFLPGKGITFSIMANAHAVATNAMKS